MNRSVLLVDPPFHAFFQYDRWWYSFPCAQLASCLQDKGVEVQVYDGDKYFPKDPLTKKRKEMVARQDWYKNGVNNENHYIWQHFRKMLSEVKPDIVGITAWTSKLASTLKVLQITKEYNPNIITCVGGYHVTALPEYFKNNPLVDTIFYGLSEIALPDWVLNGCKGKYIVTDPWEIDITKIPAVSRESLLYQEYYTPNDMGMIMTSRGCPYNCAFCTNKLMSGRKYQFRTQRQVREEIEHIIKRYGVTFLDVTDANFLANRQMALKMSKVLKEFDIHWSAEGLINAIDGELLEKFMECGCNALTFGIESGSQERLLKLNKKITLPQIERASKLLNEYGMKWKIYFIIGYPDDTLEEMEETRQFALSLKPSFISLNSFVPLPGTDIYNQWQPILNLSIEDISEYNQLNPKATFIKGMDSEEYKSKFLSILDDFERYNESVALTELFIGKK